MTTLLHSEVEVVYMTYLLYAEVVKCGTYDVHAPLECDGANGVKPILNVGASRYDPPPLYPPCPAILRPPGCGRAGACPLRAPPSGNLRVPLFTLRAPCSGIGSRE
ncbi:hypothetical protein M9H77_27626 [Catharanthus roseus]|uniref:Uncharacterized protein n=1 Tax=Catharanthus roseus TaxID=4058 RepID=A0ACC0AFR7_CATRO|nr:hypothetical protein M9H77_27626 [Catharanthus roseus]